MERKLLPFIHTYTSDITFLHNLVPIRIIQNCYAYKQKKIKRFRISKYFLFR